jgi:dienelactone hydrolase
MRRASAFPLLMLAFTVSARAEDARPPTLADLYSEEDIHDVSISPSGRYLAAAVRQPAREVIVVQDLDTGQNTIPTSIDRNSAGAGFETRMSQVYWKSDDRLLYRIQVRPKFGTKIDDKTRGIVTKLGDRLFAINRDGSQSVRLLNDSKSNFLLEGTLDLGSIGSLLPKDPENVLMFVRGFVGPSLVRVNVVNGEGTIIEMPAKDLVGWWLDIDGNPVVRVQRAFGTYRFERKESDGSWKKFYEQPVQEMRGRPDYEPVGASSQPGKYYVLARPPGRERTGVYLYDLTQESFGEPVVEHPVYDIESARAARDGAGLVHYCYVVDVRICDLADHQANETLESIRKSFDAGANIYVADFSRDNGTLVLFVEGPSIAPAYYYYRRGAKQAELVGYERNALSGRSTPLAQAFHWQSRDGRELGGYLSKPAGTANDKRLPLVVMPHGGPEKRDRLGFDRWVQYLTARGYAVFQPNFRGSEGFGRAFAESGYGEWGRAMQNDVTDGVAALVQREVADPGRICIVGASYGGYAALAGAALTPDLYKCAVSIAGVSDLAAFVKWYRFEHGPDTAGTAYWTRAIGDPDRNLQRMRTVSPARLAGAIKADVLLIHGTRDDIVPFSQSVAMKRALDNSRRKITLLRLEDEGHSYWSDEDEMRALEAIDAFLAKNLGSR